MDYLQSVDPADELGDQSLGQSVVADQQQVADGQFEDPVYSEDVFDDLVEKDQVALLLLFVELFDFLLEEVLEILYRVGLVVLGQVRAEEERRSQTLLYVNSLEILLRYLLKKIVAEVLFALGYKSVGEESQSFVGPESYQLFWGFNCD